MGSMPNLKVILLGKENTGKSCLLHRYLHGTFTDHKKHVASVGGAFVGKVLKVDGQEVKMGIWDTAGSERFDSMTRVYYRGAKAAIVCYDLADKVSTLERALFWIEELVKIEEECKIYLCGTKLDLIIHDEAEVEAMNKMKTNEHVKAFKATVFQTSSKSGYNVNEVFETIAKDFIKDPANKEMDEVIVPGVTDSKTSKRQMPNCCSGRK